MRAFVCAEPREDLSAAATAEVAQPVPGPGEALMRVRAAGVNFPDLLMLQGKYQLKPDPPFIPGMEFSGEVAALGPGVEGLRVGDAVAGGARFGAFAEFVVVPQDALVAKPAAFDWREAACFQAGALTAYVALVRRAKLATGETLLVLGAAGGVGLAACLLGRELGARVIATASSLEKRALLASLGFTDVLPALGFRDGVKAATGGRGADVIFDPVGGDAFDEATRAIAFDGRLLAVGFASGRIPTLDANVALIKGFSLLGVRAGEYGRRFPERGREDRAAIWRLAETGAMRPHVSQAFALSETKDALRALAERRAIGKLVIEP